MGEGYKVPVVLCVYVVGWCVFVECVLFTSFFVQKCDVSHIGVFCAKPKNDLNHFFVVCSK